MAERTATNKPAGPFAKSLREVAGKVVGETFRRQGFASAELVTRWAEIAGPEVAACSEPIKIQWPPPLSPSPRPAGKAAEGGQEPGTLVLRVEGPAAIEIQHHAGVICERVNRFLGWRAIARIALRQAPLHRSGQRRRRSTTDAAAIARVATTLSAIDDEELRQALARLGNAVKRV